MIAAAAIVIALPGHNQALAEGSALGGNAGVGSVQAAVIRARRALQSEVSGEAKDPKREPVEVVSKSVRLRVKLALWNETTDEMIYVRVTKGEGKVVAIEHPTLNIRLKRDNGVNSEFVVVGRPELKVVALKHPIFIDIGTARKPRWRLENVVYTPYADYLVTPEIVAAGEIFLEQQVDAAYNEMRQLNARSRAFPQQLLVEAVEPMVAKSIIAIEHVSPAALLTGSVKEYLDAFAVVLATNGKAAYSYSRSSASARGIAQFIPSTYAGLTKSRPELKLIKNFEQGMSDPKNAIMAEVALLDMNLTQLPPESRLLYETRPRDLGALLAAMYNGGSVRPRRALQLWGELWWKDHTAYLNQLKVAEKNAKTEIARLKKVLASKTLKAEARKQHQVELAAAESMAAKAAADYAAGTRAHLRKETILYVAKFYALYDHLTAVAAAVAGVNTAGDAPSAAQGGNDIFTNTP